MTTQGQNKKAIHEGQQGGPAQKNQNRQLGGAESRCASIPAACSRMTTIFRTRGRPAHRAEKENRTRRKIRSDRRTDNA
jgi:hypothetical protein